MKVYLIGAGPGDPGLLTLKGRDILAAADTVVYDYLAADELLAHTRPDAERIYVGKKGGDHTLSQDGINRLIIEKAKEGKTVARLKGGDPYMFGRGGEEAEELLQAGVPFEVVPGVTSAVAGPAYAGIPLTHRAYASSVCFATGHEDPTKPETAHNWDALAGSGSTLVFFMGMKNLPEISRKLIAAGMPEDMPAALVHWGTTTKHRSLIATIGALPKEAVRHGFSAPSLIVVGKVALLHERLNWFEQRPLFGKTVVVTRAREQAGESAALLAEQGAEVIQFPTIAVNALYADTPAGGSNPAREAITRLSDGAYDWILFTSVNGVRFFRDQIEGMGRDSRVFGARTAAGRPVKVAAVGKATAEALQQFGITPDFIPQSYVAESMAEGLTALSIGSPEGAGDSPSAAKAPGAPSPHAASGDHSPPAAAGALAGLRMLFPRAVEGRDVLPKELEGRGATVDMLPIYTTTLESSRTAEITARLEAGDIDCITFGSSSTVTNFFSLIPPDVLRRHPEVALACIGPITAGTLEKAGFACDVCPQEHTIPAMVAALAEFWERKR